MDDYSKDFLSGDDAAKKLAVKRLTLKIGTDMKQMTVNAPDWSVSGLEEDPALTGRDTSFAAQMARELLWEQERDLKLSDYIDVAQT